jgi:signal transduction histidine kinase
MNQGGAILLEDIAHQAVEHRRSGRTPEAEADERLLSSAQLLGPFRTGVCLGIWGEKRDLLGLLLVVDDRVRDAFSQDEGALLDSLAVQIGVVIDNSRQYRRMQERDRLAALGQMAAGLAHEVKNPLGAIKGAAQLLNDPRQGAPISAVEQEFVGIILEEVERLDRVVGSVLDYARPSKGEQGPVDLNAVVRRTITVLASDRAEECEIVTDLVDALPPVRADAEQLRQVLINLVRNAIQAMGGRGTVKVRTALHATGSPPVGAAGVTGDWVEVSVRDSGPGIAPQVLRNLFVPFFTTKDRGTGLGLAISQRMVEEMGGRIQVVSHLGDGATFTVLLPVSELHGLRAGQTPAPADAAAAQNASAEGPASMTTARTI